MKELISEQQAEWIVAGLSLAVFLVGPWAAYVLTRSIKNAVFFATLGPVLYLLWRVYNAIEDFYGLDSVKALGINAAIILGTAVVLAVFYSRVVDRPEAKKSSPRPRVSRRRAS